MLLHLLLLLLLLIWPITGSNQFPSNLWRNHGMTLHTNQIKQRLFLFLSHIALVTLSKDEQSLVPEDREVGHGSGRSMVTESEEMENKSVNDSVRQGILFVKKDTDK